MGKEALVTKAVFSTEENMNVLAEYGCKMLFSTYGWRLLGYITWDKKLPDEATGERRRWVKGYRFENGVKLSDEDRVFETSLHRFNSKSGELEDIVVHEDEHVVVMERKTFDLSDEEDNFHFVPNMHVLNHVHQIKDDFEAAMRRLHQMEREKEQFFEDAEHFKREALTAKEREKTGKELVNRLSRENSNLQQRIGNLESLNQRLRAKNMELESMMDETIANAQEVGTVRGMTTDDKIIHAVNKRKEIDEALLDIQPPMGGGENESEDELNEELQALKKQMQEMNTKLSALTAPGS